MNDNSSEDPSETSVSGRPGPVHQGSKLDELMYGGGALALSSGLIYVVHESVIKETHFVTGLEGLLVAAVVGSFIMKDVVHAAETLKHDENSKRTKDGVFTFKNIFLLCFVVTLSIGIYAVMQLIGIK